MVETFLFFVTYLLFKTNFPSFKLNHLFYHLYSPVEMFPLSSLILSSQFWPSFKNDTIELPDELKKVFDCFTKSYEAYKGNRTLFWRPFIGRVEVEIEVGSKKLNLSVSPIHAVIIYEFQKKGKLFFVKPNL